jgi:hypothetical protein
MIKKGGADRSLRYTAHSPSTLDCDTLIRDFPNLDPSESIQA